MSEGGRLSYAEIDAVLTVQDCVQPPALVAHVGRERHVDGDSRAVGVESEPRAGISRVATDVGQQCEAARALGLERRGRAGEAQGFLQTQRVARGWTGRAGDGR